MLLYSHIITVDSCFHVLLAADPMISELEAEQKTKLLSLKQKLQNSNVNTKLSNVLLSTD